MKIIVAISWARVCSTESDSEDLGIPQDLSQARL